MQNNFTDSNLKLREELNTNIDKAKQLVEKVNSIIPDEKIQNLIEEKKGNYFLYEDLLKNSKILLSEEKDKRNLPLENKNKNIYHNIDQINENFIVHEIQGQLEEILTASVNSNYKGIFKEKLAGIIDRITTSEDAADLTGLNVLVSSGIELVEVLLSMDEFVTENMCKSCQKCNKNLH